MHAQKAADATGQTINVVELRNSHERLKEEFNRQQQRSREAQDELLNLKAEHDDKLALEANRVKELRELLQQAVDKERKVSHNASLSDQSSRERIQELNWKLNQLQRSLAKERQAKAKAQSDVAQLSAMSRPLNQLRADLLFVKGHLTNEVASTTAWISSSRDKLFRLTQNAKVQGAAALKLETDKFACERAQLESSMNHAREKFSKTEATLRAQLERLRDEYQQTSNEVETFRFQANCAREDAKRIRAESDIALVSSTTSASTELDKMRAQLDSVTAEMTASRAAAAIAARSRRELVETRRELAVVRKQVHDKESQISSLSKALHEAEAKISEYRHPASNRVHLTLDDVHALADSGRELFVSGGRRRELDAFLQALAAVESRVYEDNTREDKETSQSRKAGRSSSPQHDDGLDVPIMFAAQIGGSAAIPERGASEVSQWRAGERSTGHTPKTFGLRDSRQSSHPKLGAQRLSDSNLALRKKSDSSATPLRCRKLVDGQGSSSLDSTFLPRLVSSSSTSSFTIPGGKSKLEDEESRTVAAAVGRVPTTGPRRLVQAMAFQRSTVMK